MKSKRLQGLVTAGRWTLPAAIFICTLCWVLTSVLLPELTMTAGEEGGSVLWQSARTLLLPAWAEHLVSFLIYAAIGYFLIELNNRFSIIRMRASVQTAIYFLLVTVCPEMHLLYAGNVAAITFLFSIYFLFKSYQQAQASGYLFYSFLFIGAGSILFPQLTFFSVLWLFEAHRFQSLTFRSFCGALVGWTMPYWMLFGHAFFYDQIELFYHPFKELATFGDIFNLQTVSYIHLDVYKRQINSRTINYHIGVNIEKLFDLLTEQILAGLCFSTAEGDCNVCSESRREEAARLAANFISKLPAMRRILATDVEACLLYTSRCV